MIDEEQKVVRGYDEAIEYLATEAHVVDALSDVDLQRQAELRYRGAVEMVMHLFNQSRKRVIDDVEACLMLDGVNQEQ